MNTAISQFVKEVSLPEFLWGEREKTASMVSHLKTMTILTDINILIILIGYEHNFFCPYHTYIFSLQCKSMNIHRNKNQVMFELCDDVTMA